MTIDNLLVRILAAGLPIVVIALIAGAAGYVTKDTPTSRLPPLPPAEEHATGVRGAIQSYANDQLTIVGADGTPVTFTLPAGAPIERLTEISPADLTVGDWINGGAIQHAQTVLALVGLVLISDPVVDSP